MFASRSPWAHAALLMSLPLLARADEPPTITHQQSACTLPGRPFTLCAQVFDDVQVARVTINFRKAGETYYSYVQAPFDGLNYCGTLPAPRELKTSIEYHVQAVDSDFQTVRTSSFILQVQPEEQCEFAPVEKDASRAANIVVYAQNQKQKKLSDAFAETGVKFVPLGGKK